MLTSLEHARRDTETALDGAILVGCYYPGCDKTANDRTPYAYGFDLSRPMGEWKKAWSDALRKAGLRYRWHDCRHSFITRLAENPAVSEETIRALAGHVSRKMLERYSHIRLAAKQAAIQSLELADFRADGAQNWAQSSADRSGVISPISEKALN